jgi:hypothetical protein
MKVTKNRENTIMSPKMNSQMPGSPGKCRGRLPGVCMVAEVIVEYRL